MKLDQAQHQNTPDAQPSPYLAFYGLAREPFASPIEFDLFYPESTRVARLDILHHLIQYGNELLLVTGPEGSGKSSLLQQFTAKASTTWEVARIEAKGGIDERNLMQQFYSQLELNFHGATHPELLDQLQHHLDTLVHNSRQGVLLVDDAHQLSMTALQRILQLTTLKNFTDKPLLRVILFGEAELEQKLDDPLLAKYTDILRRNMDLPPFNEEDSTHYILHRLSAARFVATEPFTESVLRKLYKQSHGWPGQLNALAHQKLLDSLPNAEHPSELPGISDHALYKPRRLVVVGTIIIILLGALLWNVTRDRLSPEPDKALTPIAAFKNDSEQARNQQTLAIPEKKPPSVIKPAAVAERSAPALFAPRPQPSNVTLPKKTAAVAAMPTHSTPVAPPTAIKTTQAAKTAKTTLRKKATDGPVSKQWHALPDWLPKHRHHWLNARNPQHFTLQLVAGERLETLQEFIKRYKLKRQLAFYQIQRNNKPWYALVYGEYPDKQSAIDARSQLPRKLRRLKPWVRDFAGIQQSLKQGHP